MKTTDENIRQLLEMLDNPDAYTEEQIREIINSDEETREAYRMMVEAKRSSRYRQESSPVDVDEAWEKFSQRLYPHKHNFGRTKIAASFIGVLLASSFAFAAIHVVRQNHKPEPPKKELSGTVKKPAVNVPIDTLKTDTVSSKPVIYDNIPLEKMLPEIAAHYDVKVTFVNEDARQLRFRFVWNPQKGIEQVINDLNQFGCRTVTFNDNHITVE